MPDALGEWIALLRLEEEMIATHAPFSCQSQLKHPTQVGVVCKASATCCETELGFIKNHLGLR